MTLKHEHQKHAKLNRPVLGEFHRNELAILGTTCTNIRKLANSLVQELHASYKIAYVDAEHSTPAIEKGSALAQGAALEFTDNITYRTFSYKQKFNSFQNRSLYNDQDVVLVNGNHFKAHSQIVVIDPLKPLEKKLDKLTNIELILIAGGVESVPDYITQHLPVGSAAPVLKMDDTLAIAHFIDKYLTQHRPKLNGLVLAGGQSTRMQTDKGSLAYFGKSQRLHVHQMLSSFCSETFVSYANETAINQNELVPVVLDAFTGLGPLGGILSAFQTNPNVAWLTLACDLPYLSADTLSHLIKNRNPSKLATCFMDNDNKFPEPLVTIWEPRAYPVMLQFLSQGYSCPRKVLINSDVEFLQAPNLREFINVNNPEEKQAAMAQLRKTDS